MFDWTRRPRARWITALLGLTLVFNLIDLVSTVTFVTLGYAEEANPLMASLLELGAPVFAAAKIAMVSVGVYVLWRFRHLAVARAGSVAVSAAYGALMLYHARWAEVVMSLS